MCLLGLTLIQALLAQSMSVQLPAWGADEDVH